MTQWIEHGRRETAHRVSHSFMCEAPRCGSGLMFDLNDEQTHVRQWDDGIKARRLVPIAEDEHYSQVLADSAAGTLVCPSDGARLTDEGIQRHEWTYWVNGVIACVHDGAHIELYSTIANPCPECGTDYSATGQRLAPREQWGEETGESLADIFSSYDPEEITGY
jgi:hypothetical protein